MLLRWVRPKSEKDRYDDEGPLHEVHVADFYMGRYPVTNDQYAQFLKEHPKVAEPHTGAIGVSTDLASR